jgi:hypothetical protein
MHSKGVNMMLILHILSKKVPLISTHRIKDWVLICTFLGVMRSFPSIPTKNQASGIQTIDTSMTELP